MHAWGLPPCLTSLQPTFIHTTAPALLQYYPCTSISGHFVWYPSLFIAAYSWLSKEALSVCLSVHPSVMIELKTRVENAQLLWVWELRLCAYVEGGVAQGWIPLPTRPRWHCIQAFFNRFLDRPCRALSAQYCKPNKKTANPIHHFLTFASNLGIFK